MGRVKKSRRSIWLVAVLAPCLILAGGTVWLVASESGLRWLAGSAVRSSGGALSLKEISGSLSDTVNIQQLVFRGDGWRVTLRDVQLEWNPTVLLRGELELLHLGARQLEILSVPSASPSVLPVSLGLPLSMNVMRLEIASFSVISAEGAQPDFSATEVKAKLTGDALRLNLQSLHAKLAYGEFAGNGELALSQPYVIKAQASLDTELTLTGQSEHAHLDAAAGGDLQHITVKLDGVGAGVSVNGAVQIAPLDDVPVSRIHLAFSGADVKNLLDGAPSGKLDGSVDLHGLSVGGLAGELQISNSHAAALDHGGLPLHGLTAQLRWSSAQLQLQQLDVSLLNGGHITGDVSWEQQHGKLNAQLKMRQLDPGALDTRLPNSRWHGDIKLDGIGETQHAELALSDGTLDLRGEVDWRDKLVELTKVRLARGKTVLSGHGQLALDRRRTFRFTSQLRNLDLSEFAAIPATDLNAGLEVSGTLSPEVQGTLLLNMTGSHFAQHNISGSGRLVLSGLQSAAADVEVHLGDNRVKLNIAHGGKADRLQLELDAPNLAQLGNGLSGQLAGRADLSGSLARPRLQFSLRGTDLVMSGGQSLAALDASGDLASEAMKFNLDAQDYRDTGMLNIPVASIALQGNSADHAVTAFASIRQGEDVIGELTVKAHGGLSDPALGWQNLQWLGSLDELTAQGVLPLHLLAAAPLSFGKDTFHLGTADVSVAGGHIQFADTQWTPQRWDSSGLFTGLNVRAVNRLQDISVTDTFDSMRLGGTWQVSAHEHWQGSFQMQRESGDWVVPGGTGLGLGLSKMQLSVLAEHDQIHALLDASGEHLGEVRVQANMPLMQTDNGWSILPDAPLTGQVKLHTEDLSWLGPILDSNLQSGGRLNFDAELHGTLWAPRLLGEAHGESLSLGLLDQGIRLEQGELKARFEADAVHVDRLSFTAPYQASPRDKLFTNYSLPAGSGQLSASGSIDLDGGSGDLQITADHLPLAQRSDRWIIASGTGHARYASKTLMLDGNVRADAGLINQPVSDRPRYSDDVQIVGKAPVTRAGPATGVNATLDLGDHFYIRASGFEGRLDGQLKVRGDPGAPLRVTGIIAAQDSVFEAYGQRLQVERGIVNFQGPLDDPGLNILALRKGLEVEAGVEVTGTVRRPLVRLVSTPNVPDGEKLSWIVLGRVPESSGVDSALLLAAAGSILGGQSGQLGQTLGVDEISLTQQTGGDAQQVQKVTVGKQLTTRARISYEQGLTETGGVTKFSYTLTPRITIVTRTGNEDAVDLFYTFRFY